MTELGTTMLSALSADQLDGFSADQIGSISESVFTSLPAMTQAALLAAMS
jgi:hypothetical protein